MIATPKAVYLRPFLEMRLVAELLTVPKRVMVCWVCMVFLLFAWSIGTYIPKGRERCAAPKSRHGRVAKRRSFWKGTRSLRGGRSPIPEGRGTRVLNAEPQGATPAPKRWPSDSANRRYAETMPDPARNVCTCPIPPLSWSGCVKGRSASGNRLR